MQTSGHLTAKLRAKSRHLNTFFSRHMILLLSLSSTWCIFINEKFDPEADSAKEANDTLTFYEQTDDRQTGKSDSGRK